MSDTAKPQNPILAAFEKDWKENAADHENDRDLCADRWLMSAIEEPTAAEYYTKSERDEAESVLVEIRDGVRA